MLIKVNQLIILILFTSCYSGLKVHDNYWLSLSPKPIQEPTHIRTDGIYYAKTVGPNDGMELFHYIRFFDNGQCFHSKYINDTLPSISYLIQTDLNKGDRTYYKNKGNKFKIEFWGSPNTWYMYDLGTAYPDSLIVDKYKSRFSFTKHKYYPFQVRNYSFIPLELEEEADW